MFAKLIQRIAGKPEATSQEATKHCENLGGVHVGRWGYYPVDREGYLKLKELHKKFWKAVPVASAWLRWINKDPKNRRGPEPSMDRDVFDYEEACKLVGKYRGFNWQVRYWRRLPIKPKFLTIAVDFKNARTPKASVEDVVQLDMAKYD